MADPKIQPSSAEVGVMKKKVKPFPMKQLLVLAFIRFGEPIAFTSIFPYIYYMVESFHLSDDERTISMYAGFVISAFALSEFAAAAFWGTLSDRIGRKPVILLGVFGTGLSMLIFGFSRNFPLAVIARVLGGLLNGNIGVIQTTVAEIVTVKEQQPRAYSFIPLTWCVGAVLGSLLGGALADPIKNYPEYFKPGGILETFPFLLPNLVAAFQCLISVVLGILFLQESHAIKKREPDRGLALGNWIAERLNFSGTSNSEQESRPQTRDAERTVLLGGSEPPRYDRNNTSGIATNAQTVKRNDEEHGSTETKKSIWDAFTKQVLLVIGAYGLLALHTVVFDMLLPVTLSMRQSDEPASLPFKFAGGFGLSSTAVGSILAGQAIYSMFFQLLIAPPLMQKYGSLKMHRFLALLYPFQYIVMPYLVLLPKTPRLIALVLLIIWKASFGSLAYLAVTLLVAHSAPSLLVLGMINGVSASAASLARGIGPTMFGAIHSAALKEGYGTIAWLVAAVIAALAFIEAIWLQEPEDLILEEDSEDEDDARHTAARRRASINAPEAASGGPTLIETEAQLESITSRGSNTAIEDDS